MLRIRATEREARAPFYRTPGYSYAFGSGDQDPMNCQPGPEIKVPANVFVESRYETLAQAAPRLAEASISARVAISSPNRRLL